MHITQEEWQYSLTTIHNQYKDYSGNVLILDGTIDTLQFVLKNIYGPNTDVQKLTRTN